MDEATEHKIRSLKFKILQAEKELSATQHKGELGQWLHAGHPQQMAKANEREHKRLEDKLEDLKSRLKELTGESDTPEPAAVAAEAPAKPKAAKKAAATKATAATKTPKKTAKK
jgi:hypothetical protein